MLGVMMTPFERLMELVLLLPSEDWDLPLGALAERWGEPVERIADAITAVRVLQGEATYIPLGDIETTEDVRRRVALRRLAREGRRPWA